MHRHIKQRIHPALIKIGEVEQNEHEYDRPSPDSLRACETISFLPALADSYSTSSGAPLNEPFSADPKLAPQAAQKVPERLAQVSSSTIDSQHVRTTSPKQNDGRYLDRD